MSADRRSPLFIFLTDRDAVETNVPPAGIDGLMVAFAKAVTSLILKSTPTEAVETTYLVVTDTHCRVPATGALKTPPIASVGPIVTGKQLLQTHP